MRKSHPTQQSLFKTNPQFLAQIKRRQQNNETKDTNSPLSISASLSKHVLAMLPFTSLTTNVIASEIKNSIGKLCQSTIHLPFNGTTICVKPEIDSLNALPKQYWAMAVENISGVFNRSGFNVTSREILNCLQGEILASSPYSSSCDDNKKTHQYWNLFACPSQQSIISNISSFLNKTIAPAIQEILNDITNLIQNDTEKSCDHTNVFGIFLVAAGAFIVVMGTAIWLDEQSKKNQIRSEQSLEERNPDYQFFQA
ncbi:hypothetical protein [Coxiella burnetii]|uniref:hypothetical protein n=1 Tax=Coxiella burnetii TaxID=777 RepID=UPI00051F1B4E|nr:hypothetical protein [Coxiella burnetii]AIT62831.1 putative membrane associated protein [Coxiella burnetii str. Namibia]